MPVDFRSDLFSLGSVIYAMCTGRPPFRSDSSLGVLRKISESQPRPMREINPDIPVWLETIVDRLLEKRPEQRFQTADEVAQILADCLAHVQKPDTVPIPDELTVVRKTQGLGTRFGVALGVIGTIVLTIVSIVVAVQGRGENDDQVESATVAREGGQADSELVDPTADSEIEELAAVEYFVDWNDPIEQELDSIVLENEQLEEDVNQLFEVDATFD